MSSAEQETGSGEAQAAEQETGSRREGEGRQREEEDEKKRLPWKHPWDPHPPVVHWFLPEFLRPFPSFEGWFARVSDFEQGVSIAAIMGTNYVTDETFVTILFSFNSSSSSSSSSSRHPIGPHAASGHEFEPRQTHLICELSKDSHFRHIQRPHDASKTSRQASDGFEWHSANLGTIISRPDETIMDLNVQGFRYKCHMFNEVPWDADDLRKGPEGWAENVKYMPTRWHIRSLGSETSYELSHEQKGFHIKGSGFSHQEKNWGQAFPSGHVWLQAISPDNKFQIVASVAYFNLGCGVTTPYVYAMGYRSPTIHLDLRSIDAGIVIRDVVASFKEGRFAARVIGPTHTLQIRCNAPPESFSELILCPIGKHAWKPACSESYFARVEIDVFKHKLWGFFSEPVLVESQVFEFGALEFGEELAMGDKFHED